MTHLKKILYLQILILLFVFYSKPVQAEIHVAESLEWLTVDSELIVVGTATDVKSTMVSQESYPQLPQEDVTIKIKEVLKGSCSDPIVTVRRWNYSSEKESAFEWKNSQSDILFFLSKEKNPANMADLNGHWGLRADYPYGPIDLSTPRKFALYIVSADMQAPEDGQAILQIIKNQLNSKNKGRYSSYTPAHLLSPAPAGSMVVEVPEDSAAFKNLYGGSSVELIIPQE